MTIFAPAARHFFVHASALSLAPLAPHLSSLTHPLTVALLPMSSNAIAVRANTKPIARHSTNTFLMAGFSPFLKFRLRPHAAKLIYMRWRWCPPADSQSPSDCEVRHGKYTTEPPMDCQPAD